MQQLVPELTSAVQDDLVEISNQLLKHGVITTGNHNEFTDPRLASSHVRASSLIRTVLNRIEIDTSYFEKFVKVLEENELYYEAVLDKLRVDLVVTEQPTATQDPFSDSEQPDNESSALLRPRPQLQLHSEAQPRSVLRHRISARVIGICCVLTIIICSIIALFFYVSVPVYMLLYGGKYLKCYKIFFLFLYGLFSICSYVMSALIFSMEISYIKKTALIVVMSILLFLLSKFSFLYFCGI